MADMAGVNEAREYTEISAPEFDKFIKARFRQYKPAKRVFQGEEHWYLWFSPHLGVKVQSTVSDATKSRSVGSDSMGVYLVRSNGHQIFSKDDDVSDILFGESLELYEEGSKRAHRTKNWRQAIVDRVEAFRDLYENGNGTEGSNSDYWDRKGQTQTSQASGALDPDVEERLKGLPPDIVRSAKQIDDEITLLLPYNPDFNSALGASKLWRFCTLTDDRPKRRRIPVSALSKVLPVIRRHYGTTQESVDPDPHNGAEIDESDYGYQDFDAFDEDPNGWGKR